MENFYKKLIKSSVEYRINKHQRNGETFNKDKILKEMEAIHPIYLFMLFSGLLFFIDGALQLGIFVIIGVLIGTIFASIMKTKMLVLFFSIVVYVFGAYLMLAQEKIKKIKPNPSLSPRIIFGTLSGFISAPMGITGAMMNVPILRYLGYPISKCIGSAAAICFFI